MSLPVTVVPVPAHGAEDVVVADDGLVYTGTVEGSIFRVRPDGARVDRVATTGGRPLGLELLADGRLLVADAHRGLLAVHVSGSGDVEELVTEVGGRPMRFCNNAAVAGNGDVWFSDSSTRYGIEQWKDDLVQDTRTGRLLVRRASGEVETVLDGLAFANGVALAPDDSWVAVAETAARTVVRRWLTGERSGQRELLVADLPGYPDNISLGSDGLVWVTIASPTDPVVSLLQRAPGLIGRAATAVPGALQPKPKRTVRVMAFDAQGRTVHDLAGDASGYHMVTGVREHDGRVWLGSLEEGAVAVMDVPAS
ncbi:SMP-30/gluconolactonase/LRE family protein [Nocardioides mangrovicus]|uniref:SMP-30/gluconolactonase/LRE family protein n=1 Tax=Nocardioides mangrovicus TaxID=2478913 RepID=A0A3L8P329_9ACTN|nr:SMP-30/gluconolactonase/LRE family protein [Nocardioides mangrovicus]RLV49253.1 SMP-30/gluconolactonase/LRE family protein [Nocardioides mangrovicus]